MRAIDHVNKAMRILRTGDNYYEVTVVGKYKQDGSSFGPEEYLIDADSPSDAKRSFLAGETPDASTVMQQLTGVSITKVKAATSSNKWGGG